MSNPAKLRVTSFLIQLEQQKAEIGKLFELSVQTRSSADLARSRFEKSSTVENFKAAMALEDEAVRMASLLPDRAEMERDIEKRVLTENSAAWSALAEDLRSLGSGFDEAVHLACEAAVQAVGDFIRGGGEPFEKADRTSTPSAFALSIAAQEAGRELIAARRRRSDWSSVLASVEKRGLDPMWQGINAWNFRAVLRKYLPTAI